MKMGYKNLFLGFVGLVCLATGVTQGASRLRLSGRTGSASFEGQAFAAEPASSTQVTTWENIGFAQSEQAIQTIEQALTERAGLPNEIQKFIREYLSSLGACRLTCTVFPIPQVRKIFFDEARPSCLQALAKGTKRKNWLYTVKKHGDELRCIGPTQSDAKVSSYEGYSADGDLDTFLNSFSHYRAAQSANSRYAVDVNVYRDRVADALGYERSVIIVDNVLKRQQQILPVLKGMRIPFPHRIQKIVFSPHDNYVAIGLDGYIVLYDLNEWKISNILKITHKNTSIYDIVFSADENMIAATTVESAEEGESPNVILAIWERSSYSTWREMIECRAENNEVINIKRTCDGGAELQHLYYMDLYASSRDKHSPERYSLRQKMIDSMTINSNTFKQLSAVNQKMLKGHPVFSRVDGSRSYEDDAEGDEGGEENVSTVSSIVARIRSFAMKHTNKLVLAGLAAAVVVENQGLVKRAFNKVMSWLRW